MTFNIHIFVKLFVLYIVYRATKVNMEVGVIRKLIQEAWNNNVQIIQCFNNGQEHYVTVNAR